MWGQELAGRGVLRANTQAPPRELTVRLQQSER
jgi:hypothetical protein